MYNNNIRCIPKLWRLRGERKWEYRSKGCVESILMHCKEDLVLVCLQEVLHKQLGDILSGLGKDWTYVGRGRDRKPKNGEYAPILFRESVWEVVSWQTKWLSPTPDKPSKGWGANLPRIVTIALLRYRTTQDTINVLCTHFDHQSKYSRDQSGELLRAIIKDLNGPVILAGDFNGTESEEWYHILSKTLNDAAKLSAIPSDAIGTYVGFSNNSNKVIDYIWTNMNVDTFTLASNKVRGEPFSDHRPLICDLTFLS